MYFEPTADSDTVLGSTIVQAVVRLSAPATTATDSRVIQLCRVLTDQPLQWT